MKSDNKKVESEQGSKYLSLISQIDSDGTYSGPTQGIINYKDTIDLDGLEPIYESKQLLDVLRTLSYTQTENGKKKGHYSNIAIGLDHRDTEVHLKSAVYMTVKFGKNLTSICLEQLIDICKKAEWWFVVNRCKHNCVEVDFHKNI